MISHLDNMDVHIVCDIFDHKKKMPSQCIYEIRRGEQMNLDVKFAIEQTER